MATNSDKKDRIYPMLGFPLALLTAAASAAGAFFPANYELEAESYAIQGIGQDFVNLFLIVPVLVWASYAAQSQSRRAIFLWASSCLYLAYSYSIYAFALHFNSWFLVYCAVLGLSVYGFLIFLFRFINVDLKTWFTGPIPYRSTAIFLFIISGLFVVLWLSEIIPALLAGSTPDSVIESGLLSNPVHVLDLALILPAMSIAAIWLRKERNRGILLAVPLLGFCVLMAVAIVAMALVMLLNSVTSSLGMGIIFGLIALIAGYFLWRFLKIIDPE